MDDEKILNIANSERGFVVTPRTKAKTVKAVTRLLQTNKLKIAEKFEHGTGCNEKGVINNERHKQATS